MQQTPTATGHVQRRSVHVRTASSKTGVTAAVGAVSRVSKASGIRDTSLMLPAVLEESKVLSESKALKEARSEAELTTAKSESRPNCGRKASPSNLSSASGSNNDGSMIGMGPGRREDKTTSFS